MSKGKLKVFLCHASENKPIVQDLYDRLVRAGYQPWLDTEVLLPGMDWDLEIKNGLRASDAVLVCLSKISVAKEGYIQKELRLAQDIQDEKPQGTIFLIPVRLDNCKTPYSLQDIQWADYTAPSGFDKLVGGLNIRAKQLGKDLGSVVPGGAPAATAKPAKKKSRRKPATPQVSAGDGSVVIMGNVNDSTVISGNGTRVKKNH